jgi:hypothetical protein
MIYLFDMEIKHCHVYVHTFICQQECLKQSYILHLFNVLFWYFFFFLNWKLKCFCNKSLKTFIRNLPSGEKILQRNQFVKMQSGSRQVAIFSNRTFLTLFVYIFP